ncbi:MAG: DnaD domain protein [Erysipelotrichaceae bacterium]|nr:DnaD domain protein [Erysipelotrichaceae bacterium]
MELKANDYYRIECQSSLSATELFSLSVLYAPFLSPLAGKLYYFLISEANHMATPLKHERICSILNESIIHIEQARGQLEELLLMKTFYRVQDETEYYIYQMKMPLLPSEFLKHDVFGRMYAQFVGLQQYEVTKQMCIHPDERKEHYDEITKPFQNRFLSNWDQQKEHEFQNLRPQNKDNGSFDLPISFDYDLFLKDLSYLAVPASARTSQSLKVIGELATIYGIEPKRMGILVSRSMNLKDKTLDEQRLRAKCRNEKSAYVNPNLPKTKYDVAPVQFLQQIQNGVPVTASDTRLLEDLVRTMKLSPSVVNVLVEYVLKTYDMKLTRSVTEKIAATWVRLNINSVEDALTLIQSQTIKKQPSSHKKEIIPDWYNQTQKEESVSNEKQKEDYLAKIRKKEGNS